MRYFKIKFFLLLFAVCIIINSGCAIRHNVTDDAQPENIDYAAVPSYYVSFLKSNGVADCVVFFEGSNGSGKVRQYRLDGVKASDTPADFELMIEGSKIIETYVSKNIMNSIKKYIDVVSSSIVFDSNGNEIQLDQSSIDAWNQPFSVLISSGSFDGQGIASKQHSFLSYYGSWTGLALNKIPEASIAMLFAYMAVDIPGAKTGYFRTDSNIERFVSEKTLTLEDGKDVYLLKGSASGSNNACLAVAVSKDNSISFYKLSKFGENDSLRNGTKAVILASDNGTVDCLPLIMMIRSLKAEGTDVNGEYILVEKTDTALFKRLLLLAIIYGVDDYFYDLNGGSVEITELL